jgi:hypothetical protein
MEHSARRWRSPPLSRNHHPTQNTAARLSSLPSRARILVIYCRNVSLRFDAKLLWRPFLAPDAALPVGEKDGHRSPQMSVVGRAKKSKNDGKFWRLAAYIGSAEQCSHVQRRERRGVPQPDGCLQRQMKSNHHLSFAANKERDTDTVPNRRCITGRCGGCSTAFRRKDSSTLPMLAPEQCRLDRPRVASSQHLVPAPKPQSR